MHKYIITGATGKIGSMLMDKIGVEKCIGIARNNSGANLIKADLATWDWKKAKKLPDFDTVIHLAAKAHIDNCEEDRRLGKKSETWRNNVIATENIARYCRNNKKKLIFLSTECVFDGKKNLYIEEDTPDPINWYGETKLEAEKIVRELPGSMVLRTVMAYDGRGEHRDIVNDIAIKLRNKDVVFAVTDQKISFTYTGDIVRALIASSKHDLKGLYHFAGPDALSVYEISKKIAKLISIDGSLIKPMKVKEILGSKRSKLRLKNSILSSEKFIKKTKFVSTNITDGLLLSLNI